MRTVIITIAHGRHDHLARQRRLIARSGAVVDHHVVVAMDDPVLVEQVPPTPKTSVIAIPADRAGLPLAAARNVGAEAALTLGAELMIFLDVDCLPE